MTDPTILREAAAYNDGCDAAHAGVPTSNMPLYQTQGQRDAWLLGHSDVAKAHKHAKR